MQKDAARSLLSEEALPLVPVRVGTDCSGSLRRHTPGRHTHTPLLPLSFCFNDNPPKHPGPQVQASELVRSASIPAFPWGPPAHRCLRIVTKLQSFLGWLLPCESEISGKGSCLTQLGPSLDSPPLPGTLGAVTSEAGEARPCDGSSSWVPHRARGTCSSLHSSASIRGGGFSLMETRTKETVLHPQSLPRPPSVLAF